MNKRNQKAMGEFSIDAIPRTYDAAPEKVFRAWTDPASVKAWLADGKDISIDPHEGGLFYIEMPWQERIYPHYGRYLHVESPRLLEFTWVSEGSRGKESVVKIELTARNGKTELRLSHDGLPSEELAKDHHGGWSGFLDKLVDRLK
jgi:uncharacterized protein YndB with AHSA1/START domain